MEKVSFARIATVKPQGWPCAIYSFNQRFEMGGARPSSPVLNNYHYYMPYKYLINLIKILEFFEA
jgi:hypothetical protein